jgi:glycosyltransferase involved in cell wall biosynthesis
LPSMTEAPVSHHTRTPKVTVVIPAYNRAASVGRAIASVLNQTCQDFEIIVVDDGSTDATAASVAAFADRRIRLLRHERNRGGSAARNTGIRAGSAPFVAFLDSDDEWLATKLERQLEVFERSSGRLGLVYTGADRIFPDGSVSRSIPRRRVDLSRALLTVNVVGETSLGMVRRIALGAIGGFDESLPSSQDMDLWLRICERFDADVVPEALVRIAKGDDGDRISANVPRTVLGRELYCQKHRQKLIRHGVLHLYLRSSGWWQHRRCRNSRLARRFYLESLRANPAAPFTYVLLLTTYVPMSWLDHMAHCKRLIARFLRLGPEAWFIENSSRPMSTTANLQPNTPHDSATS